MTMFLIGIIFLIFTYLQTYTPLGGLLVKPSSNTLVLPPFGVAQLLLLDHVCMFAEKCFTCTKVLYTSTIEAAILETGINWFLGKVQSSISEVVTVLNTVVHALSKHRSRFQSELMSWRS
jgi:hypothetical protein